jgi:streptogramin lyase
VSTSTSDNTQPEQSVAAPDDGYVITGYAVSNASRYTYYEQACDPSTSPQAKLVFVGTANGTSTSKRTIAFDSQPPMVIADPSYEPTNGTTAYIDAIVHTGTGQYLARYDASKPSSPTPSRRACPGYDVNNGRPWALETDANGTVWFATQTGSSMQVWKCAAGSQSSAVAFTIPGNRQPMDVDVSPDGSVLLTDIDGHIWRWDGSGDAHQLSPHQPVTDVTW